jgi:hypothetical protein
MFAEPFGVLQIRKTEGVYNLVPPGAIQQNRRFIAARFPYVRMSK